MNSKIKNLQTSNGFSLVEVILSTAVFVLLVTALVGAYLYGQESTALAGNRARAAMLAEEGLEAARNIRDPAYANLTDGVYGITTTSNQWNLSGSSDVTDIFTRQIVISPVSSNRKSVVANVTWQQNPQRTGLVSISTRITNWLDNWDMANSCDTYCQISPPGTGGNGTCRSNATQCTNNGETHYPGGDVFCTDGPPVDTCCCAAP